MGTSGSGPRLRTHSRLSEEGQTDFAVTCTLVLTLATSWDEEPQ